MTSTAQRNARARKKRYERGSGGVPDPGQLVRPLRLVVNSMGRTDRLRRAAAGDPAQAEAVALAELATAAAEVADLGLIFVLIIATALGIILKAALSSVQCEAVNAR